MILRAEQLLVGLQNRLLPLYVVHGDEPLLVFEAADALRAMAKKKGFSERETLIVASGFKWENLFLASGNLSLFGGDKLIDLRIPTGKPGRDGGEALKRYCAKLPAGVLTLITLPELDWASQKSAWFMALNQVGAVIECNAPPLASLPMWLAERLKRQQQSAPRVALEFIAAHVEGNLLAAHQEVQKLGLLFPPGEISLAQAQEAVLNVARFDIDKLKAALSQHDGARCARVLEGLKVEGAAPPLVLWTLANEARTQCQKMPARRAIARVALLRAARIDRIIKGVSRGDVWDEFMQLALNLARS